MSTHDEAAVLDEDELEPLFHLDENGGLTWTDAGRQHYRQRFARFGIRIDSINTFEDYQTALGLSAAGLNDHLVEIASNGPPSLERNLLVAFAKQDRSEYQRLYALLEARNRLALRVVSQSRDR